jgi:hypothetical protein
VAAAAILFTFISNSSTSARSGTLQLVRGDYSDPLAAGEVTHFQALSTALSGTVGLGNIAGVAVAVSGRRGRRSDDPGRPVWHVVEIRRVHAGRQVPQRVHRWHRLRWTDVLPVKGLAERSERLRTLGRVLP